MKKELLKKSHLYIIVDRKILNRKNLLSLTRSVIKGGADIIQLRDKVSCDYKILKEAEKLRKITKEKRVLFIVNDRPDIALICDADGVHLGRKDLPVRFVRKILGKDRIIGVSCHSLKDISLAKNQDIDYISLGPVFKTPLKPKNKPLNLNLFGDLEKRIKIPVFAIGGVNYENLKKVLKKGIKRMAICRGILLRKNISEETKKIKSILCEHSSMVEDQLLK